MHSANIKTEARQLIEDLPDTVNWEEIAYHIEVRASIERGLAQVDAGESVSHNEVKKQFSLGD